MLVVPVAGLLRLDDVVRVATTVGGVRGDDVVGIVVPDVALTGDAGNDVPLQFVIILCK